MGGKLAHQQKEPQFPRDICAFDKPVVWSVCRVIFHVLVLSFGALKVSPRFHYPKSLSVSVGELFQQKGIINTNNGKQKVPEVSESIVVSSLFSRLHPLSSKGQPLHKGMLLQAGWLGEGGIHAKTLTLNLELI